MSTAKIYIQSIIVSLVGLSLNASGAQSCEGFYKEETKKKLETSRAKSTLSESQINKIKEEMFEYARTGNTGGMKKALSEHPELVNSVYGGRPLLVEAVIGKSLEIVHMLLKKTIISVNKLDRDGNTALIHAAAMHNIDIVKALLDHKDIDPSIPGAQKNTVLYYSRGNAKLVNMFLDHPKTDINAVGEHNISQYHGIAHIQITERLDILERLIANPKFRLDVASTNILGQFIASHNDNSENSRIIRILEKIKSRPDFHPMKSSRLDTGLLHELIGSGNIELIKHALTMEKVTIQSSDLEWVIRLSWLPAETRLQMFNLLFNHVKFNPTGPDLADMFFSGISHKDQNSIDAILTHPKFDINATREGGINYTPLQSLILTSYQTMEQKLPLVKKLLAHPSLAINQSLGSPYHSYLRAAVGEAEKSRDYRIVELILYHQRINILQQEPPGYSVWHDTKGRFMPDRTLAWMVRKEFIKQYIDRLMGRN